MTHDRADGGTERQRPAAVCPLCLSAQRPGFRGPADHLSLFEYGTSGITDAGMVELAKDFVGAWPYLELIARGTGIRDPLDRRMVESYWVGTPLLDTTGHDTHRQLDGGPCRGPHTDYAVDVAGGTLVVRETGSVSRRPGVSVGLSIHRTWLLGRQVS